MIDFSSFLCREWHQNFREECPEGILDKQHIIKIYDEISPFGNSKDFVDNIFRVFDKDGDGTIDFKEFMVATDMTASGTPEEKLRWAFKVSLFTREENYSLESVHMHILFHDRFYRHLFMNSRIIRGHSTTLTHF